MPELVTIAGVPILRTGTYELASGTRTFAEEDLRAAADALATDQGVKTPRLKIDGLGDSFDPAAHGGEPAFGWADNLRVTANGQELLADFHVPEWLHESLGWAYPSLSIEGTPPGWVSATGRAHELVITAVALLGVDWPGVTTLDDLQALLANGPELADVEDDAVLASVPRHPRPRASLDADLVVRRFLETLDAGDFELPDEVAAAWDIWPRTSRFDDDGNPYLKVTDEASGRLYRIDFTVSGSEVTFGEFVEVVEQDVPVAAAAAPVATWASREARATVETVRGPAPRAQSNEGGGRMPDIDLGALRQAYSLPDDADEAAINAAVTAAAEAAAEAAANPPAPESTAPVIPDGMVLVDAAMLEEVREGAQAGLAVAAQLAEQDRDTVITAAIGEGRIPPSRRDHYVTAWAADADGTRRLLTESQENGGLARGLVPVTAALGSDGDGETADANADEQHDAYMARHFPNLSAKRNGAGGVRIRTEA